MKQRMMEGSCLVQKKKKDTKDSCLFNAFCHASINITCRGSDVFLIKERELSSFDNSLYFTAIILLFFYSSKISFNKQVLLHFFDKVEKCCPNLKFFPCFRKLHIFKYLMHFIELI